MLMEILKYLIMGYKLICKDGCYPNQYFKNRKDARYWLYEHGRHQLYVQHDFRDAKDVGHDINLKKTDTYDLAEYFEFILTWH